ncbi:MAG TPA: aminotransferase class III-fold pyridoxal phosphate-dependent enzyme, partial [Candidatus Angelobacter sp.]
NADVVGSYLRNGLEGLKEKHELVGDVRGMGLLQAIEFVKDRKTKEPASEATNQFMEHCRKGGLLVGKGGLYGNVIRMSPPLNISKGDVDEAIRIMDQALTQMQPSMAGVSSRRD